MKRIIYQTCVVVLMALCAVPAMAQLNGTGYYRFRNAQNTSDYISITNDKFNYVTVISTAGGGISGVATDEGQARAMVCATRYLQNDIHMVNDPDVIDLATIIYAKKKNAYDTDYDYNLIGQGTSLLTLTTGTYDGFFDFIFKNLYVSINKVSGDGANALYTTSMPLKASNNSMADLGVRYFVDESGYFDTDVSSVASQNKARWYIEPVTHFNVLPEVELNGKYYTTLKVPFEVQLSGQVEKAYKITANNSGILEYEVIATTGGTVSTGTPVLLQCGSPNAADCQLIPIGAPTFTAPQNVSNSDCPAATDVITPANGNLLAGTYYCNTDGQLPFTNKNGGTSYLDGNHRELATNKYVIGKDANGKLGFVAAEGQGLSYMPANKAWMLSAGLFPTLAAPTFAPVAGEYTGELSVTITSQDDAIIYYTTDGSTPTIQSTVYSNPITIGVGTTTIKAIAVKEGLYNNSVVAEATYTILPSHIKGDVNHDGSVTIADVTMLISYVLKNGVGSACPICADFNEDGEATISDVTALISYVLRVNPSQQ